MKILLLADIHANWPALSAIRESFDLCLFLGDLVDYGSNPVPCIEWVQSQPHVAVRGNDQFLALAQIRMSTSANNSGRTLARRVL